MNSNKLEAEDDLLGLVKAWLDSAEIRRARSVFNTVKDKSKINGLAEVEQELLDMEEAEALGCSVYAANVSMAERWVQPRLKVCEKPQVWFPGRITFVNNESVVFVVVTTEANLEDRRVFIKEVTLDEWQRIADWEPKEDKFFELFDNNGTIEIIEDKNHS